MEIILLNGTFYTFMLSFVSAARFKQSDSKMNRNQIYDIKYRL